jgi:hypothetical protein
MAGKMLRPNQAQGLQELIDYKDQKDRQIKLMSNLLHQQAEEIEELKAMVKVLSDKIEVIQKIIL